MYFALVIYPDTDTAKIAEIRRRYDPTATVIAPHVTVVFPVPATVGEERFESHVRQTLSSWEPFQIRLGGLSKSPDHWLLLGLERGGDRVREMYRRLYRGPLAAYRRDDLEFTPHLGLGLFLESGSRYDWDRPAELRLDRRRYRRAVEEAERAKLEAGCVVDRLHVVGLPEAVLEWATGRLERIPAGCRAAELGVVHLEVDAAGEDPKLLRPASDTSPVSPGGRRPKG